MAGLGRADPQRAALAHQACRSLERAGLPPVRFHDLRHTAATLQLAMGTHPKVVADMLGHASVTVTLDTYSHAVHGIARQAAADMDRLLKG